LKAVVLVLVVAAAAGLGVAAAATDNESTRANTAGSGASAPRVAATLAIAVPALVGRGTGGGSAAVVGEIGSGERQSLLLAVPRGGVTCFTATHAEGAIVEPLNCAQDAYLRVWNESSGNGEVNTQKSTSQRVLALVSAEVDAVAFHLADGAVETQKPDAGGVAALETFAPAARVVSVVALDQRGQPLAEVGT
jgi:hypothetical protein